MENENPDYPGHKPPLSHQWADCIFVRLSVSSPLCLRDSMQAEMLFERTTFRDSLRLFSSFIDGLSTSTLYLC